MMQFEDDRVTGPVRVVYTKLGSLLRAPRNPKNHDIELIHQSFSRFGYVEPIAIDEKTGRIVAGHGRLDTLQQQKANGEKPPERIVERDGDWYVPVLRGIEFDSDTDAEAYLIASNQTTIAGGWEKAELTKLLSDLASQDGGLDGVGFDREDLDDFLRRIGGSGSVIQDDENATLEKAEELRIKWGTALDQIWEVGPHRIYCGDCRKVPYVFFDGKKIRLIWTDPPYGVAYANKNQFLNKSDRGNRIQKEIAGDHMTAEETGKLFRDAMIVARNHCEPGAAAYITVPGGPLYKQFIESFEESGFVFKHGLVWIKHQFVIGMSDYHHRFEPILYGWLPDGPHYFVNDRTQDDVFEVDKPHVNADHPTQKPVELVGRMIANSTRHADIVYDPFTGSGTTLVAGHQLNRIVYAVEKDPLYVAVAIERLANLGLTPRLIS
ncbi:MAG: DNA methyltransferase [Candidatus Binataceae bacterium]